MKLRSKFVSASKSLLWIPALLCGCALAGNTVVAQELRVTEAFLKADESRMSGKCPLKVVFSGYITASGAGTVRYTFTRSDGATAPVHTLDFAEAGTQRVTTDWTLGDAAALPSFDSWQAIKILSLNELESSRETGAFSIKCALSGGGEEFGKGQQPQTPLPEPRPDRPRDNTSNVLTHVPDRLYSPTKSATQRTGIPPQSPLDANGEPRTGGGSTGAPRALRSSFRITLNGYAVHNETSDDPSERDGVGDEVTLVSHVAAINSAGEYSSIRGGGAFSSIMGQHPRYEVRAGTRSDGGGLQTGDGFPTLRPWRRVTPVNPGIPPNIMFEGELVQGYNATLIIPTIWEWDGDDAPHAAYAAAIARDRRNIIRAVVSHIRRASAVPSSFVFSGTSLGIGNTLTTEGGNHPIGLRTRGEVSFTPQALVMTYDIARAAARADFGFGRGVIRVRYRDGGLEGDYALFVQVEETTASASAPAP